MLRLAAAELRYQLKHLATFHLLIGSFFYYVIHQTSGPNLEKLRHPQIASTYLVCLALAGSAFFVQLVWQIVQDEKRDRLKATLPFSCTGLARAGLLSVGLAWLPLPLFIIVSLIFIPLASPVEEFCFGLALVGLSSTIMTSSWLAIGRFGNWGRIGNTIFYIALINIFFLSIRSHKLVFLEDAFAFLSSPLTAMFCLLLAAGLIRQAPRLGRRDLP